MMYLLDVNALLALYYEEHPHHARVESWLNGLRTRDAAANLATCSITELGFVRVASGGGRFVKNVGVAKADLKRLKTTRLFVFLDDGLGAHRLPQWVRSYRQVTDGHLLTLAAMNYAPLVTLDTGIPGALWIGEQPMDPAMVKERPARYEIAA